MKWIHDNGKFIATLIAASGLMLGIYMNPQGIRFVREDMRCISLKMDALLLAFSDYRLANEKRVSVIEGEVKENKASIEALRKQVDEISIEIDYTERVE